MYLINLIVALESPKPLINTLLATTDDHAVGALVRAGLITLGRRAPRAHRMTTALGAAFAAAVRMVDRVHRRAAHRRADAAPALRAGLAERTQNVLLVADLADYCAAFRVALAGLARAESERIPAARPRRGCRSCHDGNRRRDNAACDRHPDDAR